MMREENFYSQVRSHFENYSPEVPAELYSGMRRRLFWSNFLKFDVARFNAWYALILVGGASAAIVAGASESTAIARGAGNHQLELCDAPAPAAPVFLSIDFPFTMDFSWMNSDDHTMGCAGVIEYYNPILEPTFLPGGPAGDETAIVGDGSVSEKIDSPIVEPTSSDVANTQLPSNDLQIEHGKIVDQLNQPGEEVFLTTKVFKKKKD